MRAEHCRRPWMKTRSVAVFIHEDFAEFVMLPGYLKITGIPMQADCIHLPKRVNGGLDPQISQIAQLKSTFRSTKRL